MLFGKDLYKQIPLGDFPAPALPSLSPQVFQAAFIHSSKNAGLSRSRFAYHEDFVDNERLEFLGDALLYAIVADYLYRTYPKLRVGYLSAIRQRLVQNTTLAKFARLYKMDQALELGPDSERLRNDAKTNADTFEAFVGAVAQVHGQAAVTRWVEDLIRPYATQLYEYHASTYGELEEPEAEAGSESSAISLAKKRHRYRLCGFFPLPFLFRDAPETKSIAPEASGSHSYGTLIPVSQAATALSSSSTNSGYARLPDSTGPAVTSKAPKQVASTIQNGKAATSGGPSTSSSTVQPKQGTPATPRKPKTSNGNNYTSGEESAKENSAAIKRTKSRDRVALIPPSVTNSQVIKTQLAPKQSQHKGATSDGEQPKKSALKDTQASAAQPSQAAQSSRTQPGVTFGTTAAESREGAVAPGGKTPGAPTAHNITSAAAGWNAPAEPVQKTLDGWQAAWEAVPKGKCTPTGVDTVQAPAVSVQKTNGVPDTPAKSILKRDAGVTASSLSSAGPDPTLAKSSGESTKVTLNSAMATYLAALQSARSDPVSYLERHPMFIGKKAKKLEYDDVGSTPAKAIVRVKIDGRAVAQSAAAGSDQKLAKARAAFKAIEALLLLPDMPAELSEAKPPTDTPGQTPFKANTTNSFPDITRSSSHGVSSASAGVPIVLDTPVKSNGVNGASKAIVNPSTPAQLKKQAMLVNSHPGPFPASFYASLPTVGKENNTQIRYYVTSVKGFSSGTYHAILNADLQIIGQCHNMKKASALEEAERQAAADKPLLGSAAVLPAKWAFEDQAGPGGVIKPVRLDIKAEKRDATGSVPTLTHALAVNSESDKARLTWLEWFSEDKKAWKCAVLVDAIFQGSAKHAERKSAVSLASTKALEELEAAHKH